MQNKKRIILYGVEYRVKGRKELSDKIAEEVFMTSSQLKWEKRNCLMHTPLYPWALGMLYTDIAQSKFISILMC